MTELFALSPLDGRYASQLKNLSSYFSEYALIKYRVELEIEYFIELANIPLPQLEKCSKSGLETLRQVYQNFTEQDAQKIKEYERQTNHDVKAVEYFLQDKFKEIDNLSEFQEFIHFATTSQDVNNTSIPLALKNAINNEYIPAFEEKILTPLIKLSQEWSLIPMLARTHGQPATPTTVGKELMVFVERFTNQLEILKTLPFAAKFGGATGGLNAHYVAYPDVDWISFCNTFISRLGLKRMQFTTQIEHYDYFGAIFDCLKRINTIALDFCKDIWNYISMEYFKQKIVANEVGSSTMPHKVNPIDFENAEGNLGIANSLFEHLSAKLPVSRLQRDLTDSTVQRNIGVPFGHTLLAFNSMNRGLGKLILNQNKINFDLENNWEIVAEAIQTILRREKYPNPYEKLKEFTRTVIFFLKKEQTTSLKKDTKPVVFVFFDDRTQKYMLKP